MHPIIHVYAKYLASKAQPCGLEALTDKTKVKHLHNAIIGQICIPTTLKVQLCAAVMDKTFADQHHCIQQVCEGIRAKVGGRC